MSSYSSAPPMGSILCFILLLYSTSIVYAQLTSTFYEKSCPNVQQIVYDEVAQAAGKNPRIAASLLRLHFHDCFVDGCDGSVLLEEEVNAPPNKNSLHGFDVVDAIKAKLEEACPGVVSCADILAIVARDSVYHEGGPFWNVTLGRRDSRTASRDGAIRDLPSAYLEFEPLLSLFQKQGLNMNEMVALSGAHTFGMARCMFFRKRIYNLTNIDPEFAKQIENVCPKNNGYGDTTTLPLDDSTPNAFDEGYYKDLLNKRGLLATDQELYAGGPTDAQVYLYSKNRTAFFNDFAAAMLKMGNIKPLTGSQGEIRKNCSKIN